MLLVYFMFLLELISDKAPPPTPPHRARLQPIMNLLYFHCDVNENWDGYLFKIVCKNRVPIILPSYFQQGHLTFNFPEKRK